MRPPRFSSEENAFEMKIWNAMLHYKRADAIFFHKTVTSTMVSPLLPGPYAYALEFPAKFVYAHATLFEEECTFERPNLDRKWPISITVRNVKKLGIQNRVFAYGEGGWLKFILENRIEIGDALFFSLLELSRFEVLIIRKQWNAPMNLPPRPNPVAPVNLLPRRNSVNPTPRPNARKPFKAGEVAQNPWFVATVTSAASLEVPGAFWERNRKMVGSYQLFLDGPRSRDVMLVEAKRTYVCKEEEVELKVRLEGGWSEFADANALQIGNNVLFTLLSPSRFTVKLLNRF